MAPGANANLPLTRRRKEGWEQATGGTTCQLTTSLVGHCPQVSQLAWKARRAAPSSARQNLQIHSSSPPSSTPHTHRQPLPPRQQWPLAHTSTTNTSKATMALPTMPVPACSLLAPISAACFLPAFIACLLSFSVPSFNSIFLPLLQSTPTRSFVALACLGERLTGSDTQASPEHTLHVPLPAFRCTPPCATCHP